MWVEVVVQLLSFLTSTLDGRESTRRSFKFVRHSARQAEVRECVLLFGVESSVIQVAIQKF